MISIFFKGNPSKRGLSNPKEGHLGSRYISSLVHGSGYSQNIVQLPRFDPATHATLIRSVSEREGEVPPSTLSACANWEDVLHFGRDLHFSHL